MSPPRVLKARSKGPIVILGGAGFIGSNLARSVLRDGGHVRVVDNLSRPGVEQNVAWLQQANIGEFEFVRADVREAEQIRHAVRDAAAVFNFAAQTAVTTSMQNPVEDFEINARGALNVLEAVRATGRSVPVIFSSTNKVYGGLEDMRMVELEDRYLPADPEARAHGVSEARPLDFCTPYGCSKGVADQYVLDYAKSYGMPTAVLRMSCIYGPRQFGTEDQGWVAHFLIRALAGEPINIYGNGKQVRDILFVDDAVDAYRRLLANIGSVKGRAFNLGGGPQNAVSLRLVLDEIARLTGAPLDLSFGDWRPGDQYYFVADTRRLGSELGWSASVSWRDGLERLLGWLREARPQRTAEVARRALA